MKQILTVIALALLTVIPVRGEVLAKKKTIEPVAVDSLQLLLQAGDSCMQQFNTFEALQYFQQAYQMADNRDVRLKLADCHYKRANYHQTAELLKNVPEDSLSHEAFRQLALSYHKQGDLDSYIYWGSQLVKRYPMDGEVVANLTLAYAQKNQPEIGLKYGIDYSLKDMNNIMVNRAIADAMFLKRDFTAAAIWYQGLMEQGDSTFNTIYSAGMCYSQIQDLNRAYKYLQLALIKSGMQHFGCAYRLGIVCNDLHSYDEGLSYLDLALEIQKPDTAIMKAITLSQGEAYYLTKQYDKAVEAWKRHLDYNPSSVATYYNIANAYYYFLNDPQQSRAYLEKFLQAARKEEKPTPQLKEMIEKAEAFLCKKSPRRPSRL